MSSFIQSVPSLDEYWRSIILFGRNSASYKFALAKSLLLIANQEHTSISLEELAEPYALSIVEHLRLADRQTTSLSSTFLDTCRQYRDGKISLDLLRDTTTKLGFANVIDAFHVVNQGKIPIRFFANERKQHNRLVITDELFLLKEQFQFQNLPFEVEARWRLVETAWSLNMMPQLLSVKYDVKDENLFISDSVNRRINITSSRNALNGYQKGKCFYCFKDISVENSSTNLADVDHFFPWILTQDLSIHGINLNGVWNLVLSCQDCNRGRSGKFERIPLTKYLERLHNRNNYLVESNHPLRETIMLQTGKSEHDRHRFLQVMDQYAISKLITRWQSPQEQQTGW